MSDTPKPGSPEAVERGCTCPVMDNHQGEGIIMADAPGDPQFWINPNCPLHGGRP